MHARWRDEGQGGPDDVAEAMEVRHGSGTGMAEVCSASKGVVGR
jgi:hypothetical protein